MEGAEASLEFAYKYPFSKEAKEYVARLAPRFDSAMMEMGKSRLEHALVRSRIDYSTSKLKEVRHKSILSYIYARMLVSALNSKIAVDRYVRAEARRCGEALREESDGNIIRLAKELGVDISYDNGFSMHFSGFLKLSPKTPEYALARQDLGKGMVSMQKYKAAGIIESAIKAEVSKGLPIPAKELPREVVLYSKGIKVPVPKISIKADERRYDWIAKLLATPIADVRHRVVNLVLAPYLVNVKGMSEDDAVKAIADYIERCKQIDPTTRVNESYIRYQCRYAKARGSRPLSYDKAAELLRGVISL